MSIRFIRTFVYISKLGSFSNAARALGMTQSTVSLQMKALEDDMRIELFDRTGRRPTINAHGRAFLKKAIQLLDLYDQLGEVVKQYDELIGTLNIGSVNTIMSGILPKALMFLRQQHPELKTQIVCGLSDDLMNQVDKGEIDAALVSEPPFKLNANLSWTTICKEPLVVIASPKTSEQTDIQLLINYPFIRFPRRAWAGRIIDRELRKRNIEVRDIMKLNSLETISSMVGCGLGVSVVPQRLIAEPFPTPLTIVPFGKKTIYRNIGLITRNNSSCASLTNVLLAALVHTIKDRTIAT
jgi:DNA-binding transcriptional LysR family regulator